jgi:hypothetical protein
MTAEAVTDAEDETYPPVNRSPGESALIRVLGPEHYHRYCQMLRSDGWPLAEIAATGIGNRTPDNKVLAAIRRAGWPRPDQRTEWYEILDAATERLATA